MPEGGDTLIAIGCAVSAILGVILLVSYFFFAIWYDDETFLYKDFRHKKTLYHYSQIKGQRSLMRDGFIQQIGTPQEVFSHPANLFVAGFIGTPQMNFFDAELTKENGKYFATVQGAKFELPEDKQEALKAMSSRNRRFWASVVKA